VDFLNKIRNQPEHIRKIILWVAVIIIALFLAILWIYNSSQRIKQFPTEEFMKKIEIPHINE